MYFGLCFQTISIVSTQSNSMWIGYVFIRLHFVCIGFSFRAYEIHKKVYIDDISIANEKWYMKQTNECIEYRRLPRKCSSFLCGRQKKSKRQKIFFFCRLCQKRSNTSTISKLVSLLRHSKYAIFIAFYPLKKSISIDSKRCHIMLLTDVLTIIKTTFTTHLYTSKTHLLWLIAIYDVRLIASMPNVKP